MSDETEGIEELENDSIEELPEEELQDLAESQDAEETATKSLRELAREKLRAKIDEGFDLGNKAEKSRICHEIANELQNIKGSCSYDTVAKEVKSVLKAKKKEKSETGDGIKQVAGHSIKTKKTSKLERPARTETEPDEQPEGILNEFEQRAVILKQFQEKGESAEEMMINFTLQDVSFFIEALGLPKPQVKRLKQRAKQIAMFNEIQRVNGHPENVISISDNILKPLMMIGLFVTFAEPIVKKYFPQNDSKKKDSNGIKTVHESLRD